jgi:hypothetical protein
MLSRFIRLDLNSSSFLTSLIRPEGLENYQSKFVKSLQINDHHELIFVDT